MRIVLMISCAALALGACGKSDNSAANADMNAMATDNMMMDQNMTDQNMMVDGNAAMPGGMDGNMATNSSTENAMMKDMNTNDPDTNLANGM